MPDNPSADWFVLESTPLCNLSCVFCGNPWNARGSAHAPADPETAFRAAERLASIPSARGVTVSGGEPFVRDDLAGLVRMLARSVPEVHLATNGTLLDRRKAGILADSGLAAWQISLPAASASTLEGLCGAACIDRVFSGISAAASTGLPVSAALPLCSLNWSETGDVLRLAFASGASSFQIIPLAPGGRASDSWAKLRPSRDMILGALDLAMDAASISGIPVYTGIPIRGCVMGGPVPEGLVNTGCTGAGPKWAVDPWGMLRPCEQVPLVLGDFLTEEFGDIASSQAARGFRALPACCGECGEAAACRGGCRATAPEELGYPGAGVRGSPTHP